MLQRYIIVFFYSMLLLYASPYVISNFSKKQNADSDSFLLLQQCSNGVKKSCSLLLQLGIPSENECQPYVCHLIGAVLSANGEDSRAIPYLQKSCNSNGNFLNQDSIKQNLGCTLLGLLYQMQGNIRDAESAYNVACNNRDFIGCYNMGLLQAMDGTHSVSNAAFKSFGRACSMNYSKGCFNLAVLYANVRHDFTSANYFFHIACDYGNMKACKNVQILQDSLITLPQLKKHRGLYIKPTFE